VKNSVAWRTDGDKHPAAPTAIADQLRAQMGDVLPELGLDGEDIIDHLAQSIEGGWRPRQRLPKVVFL
jgi:hypothetical protein